MLQADINVKTTHDIEIMRLIFHLSVRNLFMSIESDVQSKVHCNLYINDIFGFEPNQLIF